MEGRSPWEGILVCWGRLRAALPHELCRIAVLPCCASSRGARSQHLSQPRLKLHEQLSRWILPTLSRQERCRQAGFIARVLFHVKQRRGCAFLPGHPVTFLLVRLAGEGGEAPVPPLWAALGFAFLKPASLPSGRRVLCQPGLFLLWHLRISVEVAVDWLGGIKSIELDAK